MGNFGSCFTSSKEIQTFPIDTNFKLPSLLPSWPPGEGFATGIIDLGGLEVCQITTFKKIWSTSQDGSDATHVTFFEPSPIPDGFFMLGCYCQSNNTPLFGWVLAGKDVSSGTLAEPVDYTLAWSGNDSCFVWLPTPPEGYKPVGYVVTTSPEKPSVGSIRCVRADLTDESEADALVWSSNDVSVYGLRPKVRGRQAQGVCVGDELNPILVEPTGSNLPQGGSNDGTYWLDLPVDETERERVKKGDLQMCEAYIHVKPMLGATFTDIAIWLFYPFNGPSTAKVGLVDIPLGRIGEHIGDWEHVTLRVSNFNGQLYRVYFGQHSGGTWVEPTSLEFLDASNNFAAYPSLNGHATYPVPGLVLQGNDLIGLRNDAAKSDKFFDVKKRYSVMEAEYINNVLELPWVNYFRKWGPKITYEIGLEIEKVQGSLAGTVGSPISSLLGLIPKEFSSEDGPTGPKVKDVWDGDER
ncbi:hypothetical protein E3N88_45959 [Mikania micrantha]|uniref:Vacuolar protein sorting-associated protein 62 n=1 Tax=Mikania micrantha TaxID=192012 RepID=A0A5N6L7P5_9ASTR|nr:hypothetical protein E3N88_45959 [Mikania micrantha]